MKNPQAPLRQTRYWQSPVDYEAWRKGYAPPSEHILIHELMFEGAKVDTFSGFNGDQFWLVTKGDPFAKDVGFDLQEQLLNNALDKKKSVLAACKFLMALSALPAPQTKGADL